MFAEQPVSNFGNHGDNGNSPGVSDRVIIAGRQN